MSSNPRVGADTFQPRQSDRSDANLTGDHMQRDTMPHPPGIHPSPVFSLRPISAAVDTEHPEPGARLTIIEPDTQ